MTLSNAGTLTGGGYGLTIGGSNNVICNGVINSGINGLTKDGTGILTLNAANSYTGLTTVSAGALVVANALALGDTASGTTVTSGASLQLQGDYISASLFHSLWERGVQLITSVRRNMKNALMPLVDKILLRKRSLIETVNDQLKNIAQIEHTRHRSVLNFMVNVVAGLISYTRQPKKPTLRLHERDRQALNPHALPFVV